MFVLDAGGLIQPTSVRIVLRLTKSTRQSNDTTILLGLRKRRFTSNRIRETTIVHIASIER
jgi:hypothetical protein